MSTFAARGRGQPIVKPSSPPSSGRGKPNSPPQPFQAAPQPYINTTTTNNNLNSTNSTTPSNSPNSQFVNAAPALPTPTPSTNPGNGNQIASTNSASGNGNGTALSVVTNGNSNVNGNVNGVHGAPPALPQIDTSSLNVNDNGSRNLNNGNGLNNESPRSVDFSNLLHFEVETQQGYKSFFFRPDENIESVAQSFCAEMGHFSIEKALFGMPEDIRETLAAKVSSFQQKLFYERNLLLRDDSRLVWSLLTGLLPESWTPERVMDELCLMEYLHKYTQYVRDYKGVIPVVKQDLQKRLFSEFPDAKASFLAHEYMQKFVIPVFRMQAILKKHPDARLARVWPWMEMEDGELEPGLESQSSDPVLSPGSILEDLAYQCALACLDRDPFPDWD